MSFSMIWGYRVSAMRRNKVVVAAAAVVVLLVVGGVVGGVVAVAVYGRSQPVVVDGPGPVGWFENGLEHLTGNAQDRTDRVDESIDGGGWMAPVMLVVCVAGVVAVGWLVVDHRRRQRT